MSDEILNDLLDFLCQNFLVEREEINLKESLVDQGIIDSFGLVEISAFIEGRYGFTIEDHDMTRENFGSVMLITEFIKDRMGE